MTLEQKQTVRDYILKYLEIGHSITPENATKDSLSSYDLKEEDIDDLVIYVTATKELAALKDDNKKWRIYKNPDYEILKSTSSTNKWIKIWTGVNAIAALMLFISSLKSTDTKPPKELQEIQQSTQLQELHLKTIQICLEKINSSIQNVADSIPK